MTFSEKELEDVLFEKIQNKEFQSLHERGLDIYDPNEEIDIMFVDRQVDLNPYGIADIIVTTIEMYPDPYGLAGIVKMDLIELKAVPIRSRDVNQVLRYKRAIERYNDKKFYSDESKFCYEIHVNPILIGNGIESGHYILNEVSDISFYSYDFNPIDGLKFNYERDGWVSNGDDTPEFIERLDKSLMFGECCEYFIDENERYISNLKKESNE